MPKALLPLLEVMLSGWQVTPSDEEGQDILITQTRSEAYSVTAPGISFNAKHKDLVSTFNELLIAIAFWVCKKDPSLRMFHGAAMILDGKKHIYLGGHKAGKSSYLARHCYPDGVLVSDDLLLINQPGQIMGLGFPLRLRRPVAEDIIQRYGANNLLPGHSLVYLGPKALPIHPAGQAFYADEFHLLENYQSKPMPPLTWPELLQQRLIKTPS